MALGNSSAIHIPKPIKTPKKDDFIGSIKMSKPIEVVHYRQPEHKSTVKAYTKRSRV